MPGPTAAVPTLSGQRERAVREEVREELGGVPGLDEDAVAGSEIFALTDGALRWTGIRPRSAARLQGVGLPWTRPDANREGFE